MADGGAPIEVLGLTAWVTALKGPAFRDVNNALRWEALRISEELVPAVQAAVKKSPAPQAEAFVQTVRAKRDRVPVVVIGKTNPKLRGFSRRGVRRDGRARQDARWRRGAMAHGIVYGPGQSGTRRAPDPAGGTRVGNFYGMARDNSGGPVGRAIREGAAFNRATDAYFDAYRRVLADFGIKLTGRR